MEDQKVYCPYCGPWNGHPNGVEMIEGGNEPFGPNKITFPAVYWYYCPACGVESPHVMECEEEARAIALRRFTPQPTVKQKPMDIERLKRINKNHCTTVWFEDRYSGKLNEDSLFGFSGDNIANFCGQSHDELVDLYGKQWRCWRAKPSDDDRLATPWNGD